MNTLPANRKLIRDINENTLLNLIKIQGPISRPSLAVASGLSLASISGIANRLIGRGIVVEEGMAQSTGGRKANLLSINPNSCFAIGLKVTEYEVIGVVVNLNAEIVYQAQFKLDLPSLELEQAIDRLAQLITTIIADAHISRSRLLGVGCGLAGFIDGKKGRCIESAFLGWHNVEFAKPLEERLDIPVYIDNDVNCFAIYERLYGRGQTHQDFLCVTIGRGVGLGVVVKGDLYSGVQGGAGEFGHTTSFIAGRLCECGKKGCLEAYVSDKGIVTTYLSQSQLEQASASLVNNISYEEVLRRADAGDEVARETLGQAGFVLGVGLANLVNIFNPGLIIVSGSGAAAGSFLFESMKTSIKEYSFSRMADQLELVVEPVGDESWARGAASLVLRQFFLPPAQVENSLGLVGAEV
jgi:predicted NBD/HSP70 family sugar kinase